MAQAFTKAVMQERLAEIDQARVAIVARTAPLRKACEDLAAQIAPFEAKMRELSKQINAIERPALGELDNERASIHRALGAKSFRAD